MQYRVIISSRRTTTPVSHFIPQRIERVVEVSDRQKDESKRQSIAINKCKPFTDNLGQPLPESHVLHVQAIRYISPLG